MNRNMWIFDSTGDAYDACQCDERIRDGDVLWIPSENVVGIAGTWPVSLTENHGELHTAVEPEKYAAENWGAQKWNGPDFDWGANE